MFPFSFNKKLCLLKVENMFKLQPLNFYFKYHVSLHNISVMLVTYTHNTRCASKDNFYKPRFRTETGKKIAKWPLIYGNNYFMS